MSDQSIMFPASFQQKRIWFLENMEGGSTTSYNMPQLIKINQILNHEKLTFALGQLMDRHEILRTTFYSENENLYQVVEKEAKNQINFYDCDTIGLKFEHILTDLLDETFNILNGPLFKVALIQDSEKGSFMFINMHHIISDGWSVSIFINELFKLYQDGNLDELPIQYGDYSEWQQDQYKTGQYDSQLEFWKTKLKGAPSLLELPYDKPRPSVQSYKGETIEFQLSKELSESMKVLAGETNATLNITLLTIFKILLKKYAGTDDIVVGSPIAGRNIEETENLIGFFANTIVTRTTFNNEISYRDLVTNVRDEILSGYSNQDIPFEKVVEELAPARNLSYNPLFQVMFTMQNASKLENNFEDINIKYLPITSSASKFDLSLSALEDKENVLHFFFEYCTDLFERTSIQRMINHFKTLCVNILNNPDQKISEISIMSKEELLRINEWNQNEFTLPKVDSLQNLIEDTVRKNPNNVSLKFKDKIMTYKEMNERSNRLAHYLRNEKAVKPNQLIGVSLNRSIEAIISKIAILKAGAAFVPIDPMYPQERKNYIVEDASLDIIITDENDNQYKNFKGEILNIKNIEKIAEEFTNINPININKPEDLAYVIYTSGSTGKPKGVLIQHQAVINHNLSIIRKFNLNPNENVLQFSSLSFDIAVEEIFPTLISGAKLVLRTESIINNYEEFLSWINNEELSVLNIPTAYWHEWVNYLVTSKKTIHEKLKLMIVGGERVSASVLKTWRSMYPDVRWINAYGPTETTVTSTVFEVDTKSTYNNIPIGRPIDNMKSYIVDSNNKLLPPGIPGELLIGGLGLAKGYLNREDLTEEKFIHPHFNKNERVYKTGDLARFKEDGNIEFLGRVDDQVKIRGFRIELGEVANILEGLPNVKQAFVTVHEQDNKKRLVGYAVSLEHGNDLKNEMLKILPSYMVPSQIIIVDSMPKNANGKIDKRLLPSPKEILEVKNVKPANEVEEKLAEVWAEVLDISNVGVEDNFFELGGDSILSIQVVSKAKEFGINLTAKLLFKHQTIKELAGALESKPTFEAEQGQVSGEFPLTPIQSWFLSKERVEPSHYNQSMLLKLDPTITGLDIKKVFEILINHHDGLRMNFPVGNSQVANVNSEVSTNFVEEYYFNEKLNTKDSKEFREILENAQSSLCIHNGPVLKVIYASFEGEKILFVAVHHLVIDGVSWRILLDDLDNLLSKVKDGDVLQLPKKTTSFKDWAVLLKEYSNKNVLNELPYWKDVMNTEDNIPTDFIDGENSEISLRKAAFILDKKNTNKLLKEIPAIFDTKINEVLITAFAHAYKTWGKCNKLAIDLEGHGREEIIDNVDLSRTIGWFTSIYPISLDLTQITNDQIENLKYVKNINRSIPNNGIGFGVLKYLSNYSKDFTDLSPKICFNYLGQLDQINKAKYFDIHTGEKGNDRSKLDKRDYLIDLNIFVKDGELNINWDYSSNVHLDSSIQSLGLSFLKSLKAILSESEFTKSKIKTPADFDLISVDQKTIDNLNEKGNLKDIYPATPMQEEMIRHTLSNKNSVCYLQQFHLGISQEINIQKFKRAWELVINRHDILKTSFEQINENWAQVVFEQVDINYTYEDIVSLSPYEKDVKLKNLLVEDRNKAYNLKNPSLMRISLYKINEKEFRFIWSFHQLLIDGWSLSIIFNEFLDVYQSLIEDNAIVLGKARNFKNYLSWLNGLEKNNTNDFWEDFLPLTSRVEYQGENIHSEGSYQEVHAVINKKTRIDLNELLKENKLTLNTLIQGLWAIVIKEDHDTVIGVTTSGRPETLEYVNDITGLFINTLPLYLNFNEELKFLSWLEMIQEKNIDMRENGYLYSQETFGNSTLKSIILFQNFPKKSGEGNKLQYSVLEGFGVNPNPITIVVNPGETITIKLVYNTNFITNSEANMLINRLQVLLKYFVKSPIENLNKFLNISELANV
ncbi:hypothetical protein A6P54_02660 [Bacillus sp. MKU004]|nr:hypothetical protein A6P54_02660 [Bacillus sp. MKU004]